MEINITRNTCRVCLKNIGLTPLFGDKGDELAAQMISSLFKIDVINHANLPNAICRMCMDDIKAAVRTKEAIINSEIMLNTYLEINKPIVVDDVQHFRDNNEDSTSNDIPKLPLINTEPLAIEHLDQIGSRVSGDEIIESMRNLKSPSFIFPQMYDCENCEIKLSTYKALITHISRIHAREAAVYECEQCGKPYKYRSSYVTHSRIRQTTRPYKCKQYDDKRFKTPYLEINKPIVAHDVQNFRDNNEDFTRNDTPKLINTEPLAIEHLQQIGSGDEIIESMKKLESPSFIFPEMYECENCEIKLSTYSALIAHTSRVHAGVDAAIYECEHCGKQFKHHSGYVSHSRIHRTTRPYKCKQCGKRFKTPHAIQQHRLTHKTEKILPCPNCDKTFCHMKGLKAHQRTHNEFTEICEICNKTFKHTTFLKLHLASRHGLPTGRGQQTKKYRKVAVQRLQTSLKGPCEFCGKLIAFNYLKKHLYIAHNSVVQLPNLKDSNISCSYCDKKFCSKSSLLLHMQSHFNSNTGPLDVKTQDLYLKYKCDECDKRFTTLQFLKNHKIFHSGKKEYVCTFCNKGFVFKWYLDRHVRLLHDTSNPRNYICDVCGKVSACGAARRSHMLSHTGETPFPCKFCDLKFVYAKSLRIHVQNKHKSKCNDENMKD